MVVVDGGEACCRGVLERRRFRCCWKRRPESELLLEPTSRGYVSYGRAAVRQFAFDLIRMLKHASSMRCVDIHVEGGGSQSGQHVCGCGVSGNTVRTWVVAQRQRSRWGARGRRVPAWACPLRVQRAALTPEPGPPGTSGVLRGGCRAACPAHP